MSWHPVRLPGLLLALALLAGCATQTRELSLSHRGLPAQAELAATPFFPQEDHQCGPASLATVLSAVGIPADPAKLARQVYLPDREGSLQAEMLAGARRHGALPLLAPATLTGAFAEVAAGRPVLVLQNLGLSISPRWHYAVLVGYDLARSEVVLRSGLTNREVMAMRTFEYTWARSGFWGLLALPPGQLPLKTDRPTLEKALAQQEKFAAPAAMAAWYEQAAQRWPDSLLFQIGLGNAAVAQKKTDEAERAFRSALTLHPDSVVALNNLATVLQQQGRLTQALALAEQAVALGGEWQSAAEATRDSIRVALRHAGNPATSPPP